MTKISIKNAVVLMVAVLAMVSLTWSISVSAAGNSGNGEEGGSITSTGGSSNGEDGGSYGSSGNGEGSGTGSSGNGEDSGTYTSTGNPTNPGSGPGSTSYIACRDGLDNDGDGKIDMFDPGCSETFDPSEVDPTPSPSPASTPSTDGPSIQVVTGPVTPAQTGTVLGATTCSTEYLSGYMYPNKKNNPEDVKKLQSFLNETLNLKLSVNGIYDAATFAAVKKFQVMHADQVMQPWVEAGLWSNKNIATGNVYKTTLRWINLVKCPDLKTPLPNLKQEAAIFKAKPKTTPKPTSSVETTPEVAAQSITDKNGILKNIISAIFGDQN